MWPFTSRRIFANRWWALAFVAFVCWQVASLMSPDDASGGDTAINAQQAQQVADALNAK